MRLTLRTLCLALTTLLSVSGCLLKHWDDGPLGPDDTSDSLCFTCPGNGASRDVPLHTWAESTGTPGAMTYTTFAVLYTGGEVTWKNGAEAPGPYTYRLAGDPFGWGEQTPIGTDVGTNAVKFTFPCPNDTTLATVVLCDSTGTNVLGWMWVLPCEAKFDSAGTSAYRWFAGRTRSYGLPYP